MPIIKGKRSLTIGIWFHTERVCCIASDKVGKSLTAAKSGNFGVRCGLVIFILLMSLDYFIQKFNSVAHYDHFPWQAMFLTIGVTAACLVIEAISVGWRRSSMYQLATRGRVLHNDVFSFLFFLTGLTQLAGLLFYAGIFYFIYGQVMKHVNFHLIASIPSVPLQFFIMLLITDLRDYVIHYYRHHLGWVWELHRFHHSAEDMTILTSFRSHAAEGVLTDFFSMIVFVIMGVPAETYLLVNLVHQAHQKLTHSQINSDWGWLGRFILVSPAAHRIHHSKNPEHHGRNFGVTFIIWDRLFGTYYEPDTTQQIAFGLPDNEFNKDGYVRDILRSYFRSLAVARDSALRLLGRDKKMTLPDSQRESVETSL
ncbi:MAG: sterol desaturase family protein [Bacteroidetes bacterium]|nr:sterol desaturase family protein [Bacteroidota bacterium]